MIVGNPQTFAIESEISIAYERLSHRALGFFALHVGGRSYGVKSWDATLLACSFDEVSRRIDARGTHEASAISNAHAEDVAMAFSRAIYSDHHLDELFLGMHDLQFKELVYSRRLVWAPDGDEAFDDSSYVLQFDAGDRVRLIAFSRREDSLFDPASLRDVWLAQDDFYDTLLRWRDGFHAEWESLSKADTDPYLQ